MGRYLSREEIEAIKMDTKTLARALVVIFILFVLFITCQFANAAQVTLQWDPNEPAPEGYQLYQRVEGDQYNYNDPIWEGDNTTATIDNLSPGVQYYFVVRAFVGQNQSGDSNEVGYNPAIPAPVNLRIRLEIGVYIDLNGQPVITQSSISK